MRCAIRITVALAVLLIACIGAEASDEDELRSMSIEELLNVEVVSSTQQYVRLQEAPSTTFVVSGEEIRRWGIRRLSELVERLVPGAISAEDFDDQILAFRGVTADNNLKVQLLLNGHDYNTQWNNGPTSEVELGLMDDIKRVEVLIGPHSAVYGSGALIAVINLITRSGSDISGVRVSGNIGTGDYKRAELIAGGQLNTDLNIFFSMGGLSSDGYDNNNNAPLDILRFPLNYKFYGDIKYKDFELMSRFTRSSRAFYIQRASDTAPNRWTNYDTFFVDLRKSFQTGEDLKSILNFNYDTVQTQRHDFTLGTKLRAVGEDRFSVKYTAFYSGWNRNDLVVGGYYRRDAFGNDWEGDNFDFTTAIVDGDVTGIPSDPYERRVITPYGRNVYALFGQDSILLSRRYSLLLGFRFDRIEAPQIPHPDTFTPRIALVIKPDDKTVLKVMFTSGLSRQPNAAVVGPDDFAFGNRQSTRIDQPESMYSLEATASYQPRSSIGLSFNFFYNSLQNIFGVDPATTAPPFRLIGAGRIDYVGFEAIATMKPTSGSFVRLIHQNVQFGSVVDDPFGNLSTPDSQHPQNYPENVTKILAEVRLSHALSANANANLIWNDYGKIGKQTVNTGYFSIVNANLLWNPTSRMQFEFSAYNIFNEEKRIPPFELLSYIPKRNFNLNFSYTF